LRDIISGRIRAELNAGRKKCLGGEGQLKSLRARLTGRDRDLIVLGLDRVLWSIAWAKGNEVPFCPDRFLLDDEELSELARLSVVFQTGVAGDRLDRVFLNRATEHVLAKRFLTLDIKDTQVLRLLKRMSSREWIANPYGIQDGECGGEQEESSEESSSFDERGCHTRYTPVELEPAPADVAARAEALRATRQRARSQKQIPHIEVYPEILDDFERKSTEMPNSFPSGLGTSS
jgi:hypothetical protein